MIRRMPLPEALQGGIDGLVRRVDSRELERAARSLSERYRAGGAAASRAARSEAEIAAYLATRAPATYAAVEDVCRRIRLARPDWQPRSLLDLGAGPGIAAWAAAKTWPSLEAITLVEAEPAMASAGRALAERGGDAAARGAAGSSGTLRTRLAEAELVIASYLLGELDPADLATFVERAWSCATDTLVVVEPGTTAGYERILAARARVVDAGGTVLAPCPHDGPCPLPAGDWCHFSVRLPRTRLHRTAKGGRARLRGREALLRRPLPGSRAARRGARDPPAGACTAATSCSTSARTKGLERRTVSKTRRRRIQAGAQARLGRRALAPVGFPACSGSPSSRERRRASARRPPAPSPARGWRCVLVARREELLRKLADEIGGEVEVCDVSDRAAVEALGRAGARAPSRDPRARQQRRHACAGNVPEGRPRPDRARDPGQLPRQRLVHARLHARASRRPPRRPAAPTSSTWSRSRAPSRSRRPGATRPRSTPSSPSRARSRRPCAAPASPSTRSCPASSRPRASRRRTCSRAGSCCAS